ncbi:MAG: phenylalanine--tRNA ligase subunit beta, partial [Actinomycetes bacterium]
LGLPVEERFEVGAHLDGIVVARVLDVRPHPDADKIRLVDVDAGDGQPLQICCGASNMGAGDLVPLATVGTVMSNGMTIAARKMRGEASNGMLCSARELDLGDDHDGLWILPGDLEPGDELRSALGLHRDVAFDLDVLPNRPDALSIMGVARDLAARQGVELFAPTWSVDPVAGGPVPSVEIVDTELCGRFIVRVVSGLQLGPSPRWMAQRLIAAGMRPISNVVDVSNYVMLELGQPTHTYDLARVAGQAFGVRSARDGEVLVTLDGAERSLVTADGVIVDGDDQPIGLAGVMGGASTEITDDTVDVAVELAWWNPDRVAATAARLNLHSEASLRFKRGVDPELAALAAQRMCSLLAEFAGAQVHDTVVEQRGELPVPARVAVRPERVNAVLGTSLSPQEMQDLIVPMGFAVGERSADGATLEVQVPSWRPDSTTEIDVVEEVGRQFGLSRIPKTVPSSPHTGELSPRQHARRRIRRALEGAGLSEAMPLPFLAPGDLERCGLPAGGLVISNPLAAEESVLRTSLLPGLVGAVAHNARHRIPGVRFFEIGRVFDTGPEGVLVDVDRSAAAGTVLSGEAEHLGVAVAGAEAPVAVELLEVVLHAAGVGPLSLLSGEVPGLHPSRSALVQVAGVTIGAVGEVDPGVLDAVGVPERVAWLSLDLSQLLALPRLDRIARSVSRFPSSDFDLAFVTSDVVPAAAVHATIAGAGGPLFRRCDLFDVFRSESLGDGRRSLAFRIRAQADDRTLTDDEVAAVRTAMIDAVVDTHGAELRA